MNCDEVIQKELAEWPWIELIDCAVSDDYIIRSEQPRENFVDCSFAIGGSQIILGIYECQEKRLASFFHELGHMHFIDDILLDHVSWNTFWCEIKAWDIGFNLAKRHGIKFSHETLEWAAEQAATYIRYK